MEKNYYFARRLKRARIDKKISQITMAQQLSVSKQAVSNWENALHLPSQHKLLQICEILDCSLEWLISESDEHENNDYTYSSASEYDISLSKFSIPIIDFKEAINYVPGEYRKNPHFNIRPLYNKNSEAFALEIIDTSMEPEFQKGDIVTIDPSIKPRPWDRVCAAVEGFETAFFRVFAPESRKMLMEGRFNLAPLNPDWSTKEINGNAVIIGVMSEHISLRRKNYPPIKKKN